MAVPNESKSTCYWCFKAVKWFPVLFIVAFVIWSYYAYVIQLCFCKFNDIFKENFNYLSTILVTVDSTIKQILYLMFYHVSFFMFCWSYWQTIFTDIGRVPTKVSILYLILFIIFNHHLFLL